MDNYLIKTPVAFIIFKRPDTTRRVFEAIRQARPTKLFVIADDGARTGRPDEAKKCAATRAIVEQVDWDCEVLKNYSEVNLGCGLRPATGITWVFEQVEEAIILEDDNYWKKHFQSVHNVEEPHSWDFQWFFSCCIQNGLSILPSVNLFSNIGFSSEATHTKKSNCFSNMSVESIKFPLKHPNFVIRNNEADDFTQKTYYKNSLLWLLKDSIKSICKKFH